jgi:hypothetical protein
LVILQIVLLLGIEAEIEPVGEELSEKDVDLFGLDLGVPSTVMCLSAAQCVPFSSCNAGAFGERHHEAYTLVAFFARPQMVDIFLACAVDAQIGLENDDSGYVVAYADDIRKLHRFAESLKQALFVQSHSRTPTRTSDSNARAGAIQTAIVLVARFGPGRALVSYARSLP